MKGGLTALSRIACSTRTLLCERYVTVEVVASLYEFRSCYMYDLTLQFGWYFGCRSKAACLCCDWPACKVFIPIPRTSLFSGMLVPTGVLPVFVLRCLFFCSMGLHFPL